MEEKKITELFIVKYDNGDRFVIENVYVKYNNGYPAIETYSEDKHGEATISFLSELTGMEINSKDDVKEAIERAGKEHKEVFGVYERPVDDKEIEALVERFKKMHDEWIKNNPLPVAVETPVVGKDTPVEDDKDKKKQILKRVGWGVAGTSLLIGGLVLLTKCDHDEDVKEEGKEEIIWKKRC